MGHGAFDRVHDWQYRRTDQTVTGYLDLDHGYDPAGNLTGVVDAEWPQRSRVAHYDDLHRLVAVDAPASFGRIDYVYDDLGNRLEKRVGLVATQDVWDYTYVGTTSVVDRIDETPFGGGTTVHDVDHDPAGNLVLDELSTYRYQPRNTLGGQLSGGVERFRWSFNAAGLRVRTDGPLPGTETVTHLLLPDGQVGHEIFADAGVPTEEWSYVYLAGRLLARVAADGSPEFVISDHIAYPLATHAEDGAVLWEADGRPFGEVEAVLAGDEAHDPRLRYPGQWVVAGVPVGSTELAANGHRWYRAGWGRYTQSDPLGLSGSLSLFPYASQNPLRYVDPLGLREILFDGCKVTFYDDDGNVVKVCRAGSGLPDTGPDDQGDAYRGPIPEGLWVIYPREFSGGWIKDKIRGPGWGRWRVPIHPQEGTDTLGRSGFFLHGDNREDRFDSAGCVDIGKCDTWGRNWAMEKPDEPIDFRVSYFWGIVCNG